MLKIKNEGIVLEPVYDFEKGGVLNPACIQVGDEEWMFYRAVDSSGISTIGYCRFKDKTVVQRFDSPLMVPEHSYEKSGLEDPRITCLNGTYYLFYTAYDGVNAQIAYATSRELPHFKKQGLLMAGIKYEQAGKLFEQSELTIRYKAFEERYQESRGKDVLLWEKDAFLFPEKIDGRYVLCHRVLPGIQLVSFNSFDELTRAFWEGYLKNLDKSILIDNSYWYDDWNVGGGCPPVKTKAGWVLVYHSVENDKYHRIYRASVALLDLHNPLKVIGRLPDPLFSPLYSYERAGVVSDVVFPTASLVKNGRLYIYHGAGDSVIALKSVDLEMLLTDLINNPVVESEGLSVRSKDSTLNPEVNNL